MAKETAPPEVPDGAALVMHPVCDPPLMIFAPLGMTVAALMCGIGLMIAISVFHKPSLLAMAPMPVLQLLAIAISQKEKQIVHLASARLAMNQFFARKGGRREGKIRIFEP